MSELSGVRELWKKNLIPIQRVTALERDPARIEGELGQLISSVAGVAASTVGGSKIRILTSRKFSSAGCAFTIGALKKTDNAASNKNLLSTRRRAVCCPCVTVIGQSRAGCKPCCVSR